GWRKVRVPVVVPVLLGIARRRNAPRRAAHGADSQPFSCRTRCSQADDADGHDGALLARWVCKVIGGLGPRYGFRTSVALRCPLESRNSEASCLKKARGSFNGKIRP